MRRFVARVEEKALGIKVLKGVKPDQQLVKVVNDQLVELMGGKAEGLVETRPGTPQVPEPYRLPLPQYNSVILLGSIPVLVETAFADCIS